MAKQKLTLYVEEVLTKKMKIKAIRVNRSLSDITEELYREFLQRVDKNRKNPQGAMEIHKKGD